MSKTCPKRGKKKTLFRGEALLSGLKVGCYNCPKTDQEKSIHNGIVPSSPLLPARGEEDKQQTKDLKTPEEHQERRNHTL